MTTRKKICASVLLRVVLGVFVLGATPSAGFADMREGIEAYKRGDYGTALKSWLPLAEQGNANALFNVAQLYRSGKGVEKDIPTAERFYIEAAERGHVAAQGNLGTLYYFAFPDSPRIADAMKWWTEAATRGDARSQHMLGVLLFNGSQAPRDPVKAYAWTRLAAEAGLPEAVKAEQLMIQSLSPQEISDGYAMAQTLVTNPPPMTSAAAKTAPGQSVSAQTPAVQPAQVSPPPSSPSTPTPSSRSSAPTPVKRPEAPAVATPAPARAPAVSAPAPSVAASQVAASQGDGSFYVQISASTSEPDAVKLKERIEKNRQNVPTGTAMRIDRGSRADGSDLFKVQIGPFGTKKAADNHCSALKKRKQSCFVVSG